MSALDIINATSANIGSVGSGFYFTAETRAVGKELGLDGFRFYVIGRGGVLGDVDSSVVAAAFGYFSPAMIDKLWTSSTDVIAPREAGHRYHQCAAEFGRQKFSGIDGLDAYCAAAEKVIAAQDRDGLSLFAGIAAEPLVDDVAGRAMQLTAVLREHRGSAHLAAVLASGIRPRSAHFAKRPEMVQSFGYEPSDVVVEPGIEAKLAHAESLTDAIVERSYSVLSEAEGAALVTGAGALKAALA